MFKATLMAALVGGLSLASQAQVEALPPQKTKIPMSQMCIEDICLGQTIGYMPASRVRNAPYMTASQDKLSDGFKALQDRAPYCTSHEETVFLALPSGRVARVLYEAFPLRTGLHMFVKSVEVISPGNFTEKQTSEVFETLSARMQMKPSKSNKRDLAMFGQLNGSGTFMPWNADALLAVQNSNIESKMTVTVSFRSIDWSDRLAAQPHCAAKTPSF